MHEGNKYFTVRKQTIITSPPFTVQTWKQFYFVYYSLLYILLHWTECNNQPEGEISTSKAYKKYGNKEHALASCSEMIQKVS